MWIGTTGGLNRYDGHTFKVFKASDSLNRLNKNHITTLYEDQNQTLWVGTFGGGLHRYNSDSESFFRCNTNQSGLVESICENPIGQLWVGFQGLTGGLGLYDPLRDSLMMFNYKKKDSTSTNSQAYIQAIRVIAKEHDNIWVGTWRDGLLKFNTKTKTFSKIDNPYILNNQIISLHVDEKNLWIGTFAGGLIKYSIDSDQIKVFKNSEHDQKTIPGDRVSSILFRNKTSLWIATNFGLCSFDTEKEIFNRTQHNFYSSSGLSGDFLSRLYQDRTGLLWVGTQFNGLNILQTEKLKFQTLQISDPNDTQGLSKNNITSLLEDPSGGLWIGTFGGGLNEQTQRTSGTIPFLTSRFKWHQHADNDRTINTNGISSLAADGQGKIWIAHGNGGLNVYDPVNRKYESFLKKDKIGLTEDRINNIYFDSRNKLWIGTLGGGLNIFDTKTKKVIKNYDLIPNKKNGLSGNAISCILETSNLQIWIGHQTFAGIDLFQEKYGNFLHLVVLDSDKKAILDKHRISSIIEGEEGMIWCGTNAGVYGINVTRDTVVLDDKLIAKKFIRYHEGNGLPTNEIAGLILWKNQLWISTNKGVSYINISTNKVINFDERDGLQKGQFYQRAALKMKSGHLLFGGNNGVTIFHPDSIEYNRNIPRVVLTNLNLVNHSVSIDTALQDKKLQNFTISKSVVNLDKIEIPHDINIIELEFASLDFTSPAKNKYAYQMVGFDPHWIYSGNKHSATYTNLDPGTYVFRVKGSNNDGIWNEQGASIKIAILPPPWKTWWAYTIYVGCILGLIAIVLNEVVKRERLKSTAKIKELEVERYHELDTIKSRFFANISHEFRTPLTLLLSPIEKRLKTTQDAHDKTELGIMHRNATRLLTLVNQLLDLSRLEAGTLSLQCSKGSLNLFVNTIASQFSSMADSKKIDFAISANQEITLYFDSDKLDKIITNLLSNAFKFTPTKGSITITLSQYASSERFKDGFAEIAVWDSGKGIAHEHLDKIFDRFYQADTSSTREYEGSGIGLALTKELVELHKGSISVTSIKGEGSCFSVKLPLGSAHLKPHEIIDNAEQKPQLRIVHDLPVELEKVNVIPDETELPKVLIIEDNADLRYYLRTNFASQYSILEAQDGEMGLEVAIEGVPDLIVSDLMMPKMDGLSLCSKLKANEKTSHIPVILLTAKADIDSKLQGLNTGADDYIAKPFDARELEVRVRNLIETRKKLQRKFSQQLSIAPHELKVESIEDRFLKKVRDTIEQHMADTTFGVEVLANEVAMSSVQVYRKLKALTGYTPNELIRNFRLERAASLLSQHAGNVSDVAYQVGFNNLSYFAKCFKEKFETSPSEFLKDS